MKSITRFSVFILASCLFIYVCASNKIDAQPVDTLQAKTVAKNFFADRLSRSRQISIKGISFQNIEMTLAFKETENLGEQIDSKGGSKPTPLYYIFNVKDKLNTSDKRGFIIISADQRIPSVLGYSFIGEFPLKDQAPALKEWMDHYKEQIIYVIKNKLTPDPKITDEWKNYSAPVELKSTEQLSEVTPLLTTLWSQYGYYNNLCPADNNCGASWNGHVPAGCVAIAMAQIMKYWDYPASNNPIPGYNSANYGWQPDIGTTTYDWSSMPDEVNFGMTPSPTTDEINAVSTLVYHCGVAVQMKYAPTGSGAGSPMEAFKNYFKYSPDIEEIDKSTFSPEEWEEKIRNELDNNRPVFYSGYSTDTYEGGHSFVCDGYQDENYFDFNWGLSFHGGGNGHYYLNDLTPGSHDFTFKQWAIINISPTSPLVDADRNYYDIVEIGPQVWMAENLKTTKYNDGTAIAYPGLDKNAWESNTSGAYAWWDNNESNKNTYGALYNCYAVNSDKLCPSGWHVPSLNEWLNLMYFLGGSNEQNGRMIGGGLLKETGNEHWKPSNVGAMDIYGFTALPGGNRGPGGDFYSLETSGLWYASGNWWKDDAKGTGFMMYGTETGVWYGAMEKNAGISVRCVKDITGVNIPVDGEAFMYGYISSMTPNEEQWYKFLTGPACTYNIQTYGSMDTYMVLYDSNRSTMIAEDNNGAGSGYNAKIAITLDANTWYYVKIKGYNNSTGGYSIDVHALPDAPDANNVTVNYDGLSHTAGASVPPGISVVWYNAPTGGSVTTQPAGISCGTYKAYAEAVNDVIGSKSLSRTLVTLTISKANLIITAKNKSSQYSDPLQILTYEITGFVNGETTSVVTGSPVISTSATQFSAPGEYPITISAGTLSTVNYYFSSVDGVYTIAPEDARVDYTGPGLVATANAASGIATITLRTTVQDISATSVAADDIYPGDIRKAKVRFLNGGAVITGTDTDANGWITPVLVNNSDLKTGVIVLNWTVNIGAETDKEYIISTEVTSFYTRSDDNDNTLITVYKPTGDFITGGGYIINPDNTAGTYAGDPGRKTHFGFNVKYNKSGKNLQGNINILLRRTISGVVHTFLVKSNSMTSLGVNINNAAAKTAVFVSKVTMKDLTNPLSGYSKGGLTLQINMTDRGEPGKSDAIAMSVYDGSMLLFSSNWTGTSTAETVLSGGNLLVHSGFSLSQTETQTSTDNPGMIMVGKSEFSLIAYPNPFTDRIYFDLQMQTDSKILLEIYDLRGSKLATIYNDMVAALNRYRFEYVPKNVKKGLLVYRLKVDGKLVFSGILIHY